MVTNIYNLSFAFFASLAFERINEDLLYVKIKLYKDDIHQEYSMVAIYC